MGIENFMTFILTAMLFVMTPGIDTMFVLNKSIGQGRKSGIYATLGINTGVLTHALFGAVGLSVLIAKSAFAFTGIKYAGAIYIIYMGFIKLKAKYELLPEAEIGKQKTKSDFWSGFLTNTLNPKVALFFLAFFPQFITPEQLHNPMPFIILGLTFSLIGMAWYLSLTLMASTFFEKIKHHPKLGLWVNKFSGLAFILMGLYIGLIPI
ncbi:LysE family translocator [Oceanihabitans sp. IOP_32]|uniref:LysE family translocator n=1 Tax=Oceanihabitans sp. IOP_32 TaxID=2529032 RepID=UPI0012934C98|nr:LysE family translocator [Oceanihabitans sp. IOP_32]QFZ54257.1 LysE family translocator [Oceanihabitans sp. IOP_32]